MSLLNKHTFGKKVQGGGGGLSASFVDSIRVAAGMTFEDDFRTVIGNPAKVHHHSLMTAFPRWSGSASVEYEILRASSYGATQTGMVGHNGFTTQAECDGDFLRKYANAAYYSYGRWYYKESTYTNVASTQVGDIITMGWTFGLASTGLLAFLKVNGIDQTVFPSFAGSSATTPAYLAVSCIEDSKVALNTGQRPFIYPIDGVDEGWYTDPAA